MTGGKKMRVIAGDFKGRKLTSLQGDNTRPTSDKIKGSVFNMIGPYFYDGEIVLDLYSGSGNLGIEAVSRGAVKAYCFDHHFKAVQVIQENVALTKQTTSFEVKKMDAEKALHYLADKQVKLDLVFLDPPYAKQLLAEQLNLLQTLDLLNSGAVVVCEMDKQVDLPSEVNALVCRKEQKYGATKIMIYDYIEGDENE